MSQAPGLAPLIVLEGIDGSGKGTQAARLHSRLNEQCSRAELLSFPRYQSTFFGARIGEFLNGQFGTLDQVDPFLISMLYAGDRFESKSTLQAAREQCDFVVLDRYVPSNVAHQAAKRDGEERARLRSWIEKVEFELFGLPQPELVIHLDIPVEVSQQLIRKKQRRSYTDHETDLQETDVPYLAKVRGAYQELASSNPSWITVPVTHGTELRPVEEISQEIWELVNTRFPLSSK